MESIQTWFTKIIEEVAPDEVDLAPSMLEVYLRGGKERQELFKQHTGNEVGSFGVSDLIAITPWIISGLAIASSKLQIHLYTFSPHQTTPMDSHLLQKIKNIMTSELQLTKLSSQEIDKIISKIVATLQNRPIESSQFLDRLSDADIYTLYQDCTKQLIVRLGKQHPRYLQVLTYQNRLLENIESVRQFGDTGRIRDERIQIIQQLNRLALTELGISFNHLCEISS